MTEIEYINMIGAVAGVCTTVSFIPQVLHVYRTRSVQDISAGMYSLLTLGLALWIGYGVALRAYPIIISNSISFVCVLAILIMKLTWGCTRGAPRA